MPYVKWGGVKYDLTFMATVVNNCERPWMVEKLCRELIIHNQVNPEVEIVFTVDYVVRARECELFSKTGINYLNHCCGACLFCVDSNSFRSIVHRNQASVHRN